MSREPQAPDEDDETGEVVEFTVPIDLETVAWLMELADSCHAPPSAIIASILRDVRLDDQTAHDIETAPAPTLRH